MGERRKLIKASELGEYVFCARAWRLRADGHEPAYGQHAREAGTRWHLEHGQTIRRAARLRLLAALSAVLTLLALLLFIFLWWRG